MTSTTSNRLGSILTSIAIGVGFVLFGLATDLIDRSIPIQGRPSFESAATESWLRASLFRLLCGIAIGLCWRLWQSMTPGIRRRWSGHLLCFTGAALLRGSLGAWLNAPLEHIVIALMLGGAIGTLTFALAELAELAQHPPPPARLP